ncbi:AMP-binding protein [Roseibium alexandrii]|uniref:Putative acyl--CoA ligase YhfT n=1 Tax=Roseibium alexandrii TaxID=388408 RepID=A0A0M7ATF1_9HYPH|nr:AMP-binding protein [Roseibium alexandrii]CTQ77063.1 putative acyl--CoA ligase YhfT [Roseibium alexandrii]
MGYIGEHLEKRARASMAGPALKTGGRGHSWEEFLSSVQEREQLLWDNSPEGAQIALLLADPTDILVSFFACARSGRTALVMDPSWPHHQIETVLMAVQPAFCLDDESLARSVATQDDERSSRPVDPPLETAEFYAGFTSGSTGMPKGFVRSHRSWLESFRLSEPDFEDIEPARIIILGGLSHSLHLYGAVHGLHRGTPVTVLSRFEPRAVLEVLQTEAGIAALYATPTQLQLIAEAARRSGSPKAMRLVFSSGAKWPDGAKSAFAEVFPKARLVEFYGASETSFISFARSGDGTTAGSVGRPPTGVSVAIGNPDQQLLSGTPGPIWVKSPLLFNRYVCGEAPETVWQGDWVTIGDHGYVDDAGYLFVTGRQNRMVITSGLNVYPEEIETVLMSHPAVKAAAVFGVTDALRGERLEAVVELHLELEDPAQTLVDHCRRFAGRAKCPKRFHMKDKFPLTAGGKPDLQALKREFGVSAAPASVLEGKNS